MKIEEIRAKTDSELDFEIEKMKKELFELRFRAASGSEQNTARIGDLRRSVARVKTIVHERALGISSQPGQ